MNEAGMERRLTDEQLAERFHEAYERLASSFGYRTRDESAVPWTEVPDANRALMIATVSEIRSGLLMQVDALRTERDQALLAANDNAEERDRNKARLLAAEAERDRVTDEREVYRNASIRQEAAWHDAVARAEAAEAERDAVVQAIWSMHSMIVHELDSDPMDDPMDYVAVDGAEATAAACRAIADGRERYMESNEHTAWINR